MNDKTGPTPGKPMEELKKRNATLGIVSGLLVLSLIGNAIFMNRQKHLKRERDEAWLSRDSILSVKLTDDKALDKAKAALEECKSKNSKLEPLVSGLNEQAEQKKMKVKNKR